MSAVACLLCLCCCTVIQPTGCQIKIKICSLWYVCLYSLVIPQFFTEVLKPICSTNLILHNPLVPSGLLFTGTGLGWDLLRIIFCALVFTLMFFYFWFRVVDLHEATNATFLRVLLYRKSLG